MHKGGVFGEIYANKKDCEVLCNYYTNVYANIRDEERSLTSSSDEASKISTIRDGQIAEVRRELEVIDPIPEKSWQEQVRDYVERYLNFTDNDFEKVWSKFLNVKDRHIKENILAQIPEKDEHYEQLESRM